VSSGDRLPVHTTHHVTEISPPSAPTAAVNDASAVGFGAGAEGDERAGRARQTIVLALILLLALWVRLRDLGRHSLWFDEAVTAWIASKPVPELIATVDYWERTPPLHYLLVRAATLVLGDSERAARLPSVIAGVGSVWLVFLIGRRLFDWRAGAAAALLLAVSPYQVLYSQEARAYALMECLALASCCLFLRSLEESARWRTRVGFSVVTALMLYAHLYSAFVIVAQNVYYAALWIARARPGLRPGRWALMQAGVVALFAPWLPTTYFWTRSVAATFWVERFTADEITRTWWAFVGSGPALMAVGVLAVIGAASARNRRGWAFCALMAATPVVAPVVISLIKSPMFTNRYGIVASPWLSLLAGAGIVALRWRAVQLVALLCVSLLPVLRIDPPPENLARDDARHDWRGAGRFLEQSLQPGDYVAINAGGAILAYQRYVARRDVEVEGFANATLPVPATRRPGSRVWLVLHTPMTPPRDILASGGWRVVSRHPFNGIEVWQLEAFNGPGSSPASTRSGPQTPPGI
jgi:mannosyltransferase